MIQLCECFCVMDYARFDWEFSEDEENDVEPCQSDKVE